MHRNWCNAQALCSWHDESSRWARGHHVNTNLPIRRCVMSGRTRCPYSPTREYWLIKGLLYFLNVINNSEVGTDESDVPWSKKPNLKVNLARQCHSLINLRKDVLALRNVTHFWDSHKSMILHSLSSPSLLKITDGATKCLSVKMWNVISISG